MRTNQEWFDFCMDRGTSGDQVFDVIRDWKAEQEDLNAAYVETISDAEEQIKTLTAELDDCYKVRAEQAQQIGWLKAENQKLRKITCQ